MLLTVFFIRRKIAINNMNKSDDKKSKLFMKFKRADGGGISVWMNH